jgi:hypothetical protein
MGLGRIRTGDLRRVWADVSFQYENYADVDSPQELSRYLLKFGRVNGVYEDEEIAHDLKRTVAGMLRRRVPRRQVVEETSVLYGSRRVRGKVVAAVPA